MDSQGIDKNLAKEARQLGAVSAGEFEDAVKRKRDGAAKRKLAHGSRNPAKKKVKANINTASVRAAVLAMIKPFRNDHDLLGVVFEELRHMLDELQNEMLAKLGEKS